MKHALLFLAMVSLVSACSRTPTRVTNFAEDVEKMNCDQLEAETVYQATILAHLKTQVDKEMDMNGAATAALSLGFSAINNAADDSARQARIQELRRNLAVIQNAQHEKKCSS